MNWTFLRSRLALGAGIAGVAALGFAGGVAWTHNAGTAAAAMDLQAQHGFTLGPSGCQSLFGERLPSDDPVRLRCGRLGGLGAMDL
mgnify:CR=1 FL=1